MATSTSRDYNIYARQRRGSDVIMYKAWLKGIMKINATFVARAKAGKGKVAPLSVKQIESILIPIVRPAYGRVAGNGFETGIDSVQRQYGRPLPSIELGLAKGLLFSPAQIVIDLSKASQSDLDNLGLGSVQQELQTSGMGKVKDISETSRSKMQRVMNKSIEADESQEQLANRLKSFVGGNQARARGIAQTETTKVFNAGTLKGYEKSRVVSKKGWVTNIQGNPRTPPDSKFNHLGANGEEVDVNKPFIRTGESLMHPADSAGSAGNIIRCHCGMRPIIGKRKLRAGTANANFVEIPKENWEGFGKDNIQLSKPLIKDDFKGINNYMASGNSFRMNNMLRGKEVVTTVYGEKVLSLAELKIASNKFSKAIKKSKLKTDVKTYRGVSGDFPNLKVGDIFIDDGFTSVTLDINHASKYVWDGRILEIQIPKGTNVLWEKNATDSKFWGEDKRGFYEKELVLDKGTKYKFIRKELRPDSREVDIIEVIK